MLNPSSMSEDLLFTTVKLENSNGIGTGFIYIIKKDENTGHPIIITNNHVCNKEKSFIFQLHYLNEDGIPSEDVITFDLRDIGIVKHPEYDLCCFGFGGLLDEAKNKYNKDIYFKVVHNDYIWDDNKLLELRVAEDIVMYGYPIGLYDEKNTLPLIRKGISSSHPAIDFNGKSIGVIDAACFPGSSGSPIFIMNENLVPRKDGNVSLASRLILLGVLSSGPIYSTEGKLEIKDIPMSFEITTKTDIMINLGYYIKAKEILNLVDIYKEKNKDYFKNTSTK